MYNVAFRIVQNNFVAEEVVQESFVVAYTKLDQLQENVAFGGWLKKIVVNSSYAYLRKHGSKDVSLDAALYKIEDEEKEEEIFVEVKVQEMLAAMKLLKTNYRVVLTLFFIEGYDYEEISEILGVSNGNCRVMLSRAKESLRKKIEEAIIE